VSASWFQNYVNKYYQKVEQQAEVVPKVIMEADGSNG